MQEHYILTESNPQGNSLDALIYLGMINNYGKFRHTSVPKKKIYINYCNLRCAAMSYWFSANSKNHKIPHIFIRPGATVHSNRLGSNIPMETVSISTFCYFVTNTIWKNESTPASMNEKFMLPQNPLELWVTKCRCGWHLSYLCHLTMNVLHKIVFVIV